MYRCAQTYRCRLRLISLLMRTCALHQVQVDVSLVGVNSRNSARLGAARAVLYDARLALMGIELDGSALIIRSPIDCSLDSFNDLQFHMWDENGTLYRLNLSDPVPPFLKKWLRCYFRGRLSSSAAWKTIPSCSTAVPLNNLHLPRSLLPSAAAFAVTPDNHM